MALCKKYNFTAAIIEIPINKLFLVDKNKSLTGSVGKMFHEYHNLDKNNKCTFIPVTFTGSKYSNNTFTGVFKLFYEKKIDFYLKGQSMFFTENFIVLTKPIYSESMIIGEMFKMNDKTASFLNFLDLELNLRYLILISFFIFFLLMLLMTYFIEKKNQRLSLFKIGLSNLLEFEKSLYNFSYMALIILWFKLFTFIFKLLLSSRIKTNKVVVDTSEIVKDGTSLFYSKRHVCWLRDEFEYNMARTAPPRTLLNRIFLQKRQDPLKVCIFDKKISDFFNFDQVRSLFLMNELNFVAFMHALSSGIGDLLIWMNLGKPIFESVNAYMVRNTMEPEKFNYINRYTTYELENHLISDLRRKVTEKLLFQINTVNKIYTKLEDYIDDYTTFDNLGASYFLDLYYAYYTFNITILLFFTIYSLFKLMFASKKKML